MAKKITDNRDWTAMREDLRRRLNEILMSAYSDWSHVGFDPTEVRLTLAALVASRTYEVALEDHQKKQIPVRKIDEILKIVRNRWDGDFDSIPMDGEGTSPTEGH